MTQINMKPSEDISNAAIKVGKIAGECISKISVFNEMFGAMSRQEDPIEFEDHNACFLGLQTICNEISTQLMKVEDCAFEIRDDAEICSLDPGKLEEKKKSLVSSGFEVEGNTYSIPESAFLRKGKAPDTKPSHKDSSGA